MSLEDSAPSTYLIRSNTVTRLPTGESRQVPSGVNNRFPLLYTVPKRLENWVRVSFKEGLKKAKTNPKFGFHFRNALLDVQYRHLDENQ